MFFVLSKVLWSVAAPGNLLLFLLVGGTALLFTRWRRTGRWMVAGATLMAVAIAIVPFGNLMFSALEDRFPQHSELPERVDGIVVLGGVVDLRTMVARHQTSVGDPIERLFAFAELAERYPAARLVFTGGTGHLDQKLREADYVRPVLARIGLDPERVLYDDQSRNTYENAILARDLAVPKSGENWVLITSAAHMPRAVGCFRKAGWTIIPYPVDYHTHGPDAEPSGPGFAVAFAARLRSFESAAYEWLGLLAYRLTGRTDTLFPGPNRSG